jgi:hypothetical protein
MDQSKGNGKRRQAAGMAKPFEAYKFELKEMLDVLDMPLKASYRRGEVCSILSISDRQFWNLVERYEPGPGGEPTRPDSLDSYMMRRERRVTFAELVNFLRRNNSYQRRCAIGG